MAKQEIHIELLLGQRVRALNGRSIGRLEEVRAEKIQGEVLVQEYLVGSYAGLERLASLNIGRAILRFAGIRKKNGGYRVPWDKLDLSDPTTLRLLCPTGELSTLDD